MKEKWSEIRKSGNFAELGRKLQVSPVVARILRNRDIVEEDMEAFLRGGLDDLADPHLMKDLDSACDLLIAKIREKKKIRVIGDYDIDGVCASFILERSIRNCFQTILGESGDGYIDTVLPHRIIDGYGLNIHLIDQAIEDKVDTIITCDNGISAAEEIRYGMEKGMTIIVTDHHEVPFHMDGENKVYDVPQNCLLVNPKQKDCEYPFKELCGAAVVYRLSQVLYEKACPGRDRQEFLDIAAFATIGDVMQLVGENRIIVREGLRKLKNTENEGMRALIEACGLEDKESITPYHVGFVLGPCLNAAGRLDTAQLSQSLLKATGVEAGMIANHLQELNLERRTMTEEGLAAAEAYIDSLPGIPPVIVVYLPECHESLAGIIAGKIREKYNHPALVLTRSEEGVKGSGRSIEEYDMFENMSACRDLFSKFGGHKLAAGFSMTAETDYEKGKAVARLDEEINRLSDIPEEAFMPKIRLDMVLPFSYITENLINELEKLSPCGNGNRRALFGARNITLHEKKYIGKEGNVFKAVAVDETGTAFDVIYFRPDEDKRQILEEKDEVVIAFYPQINEYKGRRSIQLNIESVL